MTMMTTETTELLTAQWGTDPRPPVLPDPWERRDDPAGKDRANRAALRNRPDFGWAFAERIASSRRPCPVLKLRECRWIRAAKHHLTGGTMAVKHLRDADVVVLARKLYESKEFRPVLNAALMTRGATVQTVADALKIKPAAVVEAYHDLFFSVLDRKDDLPYLKTILGHGKSDSLFIDVSSLATDEEILLRAGFEGIIDNVLRLAGLTNDEEEETEEDLSKQMKRNILKHGVNFFASPDALKKPLPPIVCHAIGLVKKAPAEQAPAFDPADLGDFRGAARAILEGNRKIVEASIEQQLNQKAQVP
jgi:hypothetical protein